MKYVVKSLLKSLVLVFGVMFFSVSAQAIQWEIIGACDSKPLYQGTYESDLRKSVGQFSLEIFSQNNLAFQGNEHGINSLLNTPVGLDAIEVISDEEMRVYGWCYLVNGEQPEELASAVGFDSQADKLTWFYAYSTNFRNEWLNYCLPAHELKPAMFCSGNSK